VTIDPKDWFNYDFETGVITWSRNRGRKINGRNLEKYQGNISKHGNGFQVQQSINGKQTYLGFSLDYEEAKTIFKNHERLQD